MFYLFVDDVKTCVKNKVDLTLNEHGKYKNSRSCKHNEKTKIKMYCKKKVVSL